MKVTIKDVAKQAGVSIATVSKVINNKQYVSDETIAHVKKAISDLGFVPNSQAAGLARKSTRNVIFLSSLPKHVAYSDPHMFDILCGVQNCLAKKNYSLNLADINTCTGWDFSKTIFLQSADGIIVHGTALNKQVLSFLVKSNLPHIVIGSPEDSRISWVDTNHELGGKIAADHLIERGYTKIGFIGEKNTDSISNKRLDGFIASMNHANLPINGNWIMHAEIYLSALSTMKNLEESYTVAYRLLRSKERPQALIFSNSILAYGFHKVAEEEHIRIPNDIAFITFDQYPYSSIMNPLPTYIDIDLHYIGYTAGQLLLKKIKNPELNVQSYTTLPRLSVNSTTPYLSVGKVSDILNEQ